MSQGCFRPAVVQVATVEYKKGLDSIKKVLSHCLVKPTVHRPLAAWCQNAIQLGLLFGERASFKYADVFLPSYSDSQCIHSLIELASVFKHILLTAMRC